MLRTASAALLLAIGLAVPLGAAQAGANDGILPPASVGSDGGYQDPGYQSSDTYSDQGYGQGSYQTQYDQPTYPSTQGRQPERYVVAQDSTMGDLLVRIQRLEGANRQLNGTVEDLQSQIRKLQDDLKRQQGDTEYRLQALENGGGKGPAPASSKPAAPPRQKSGQGGPGAPPQTLGSLSSDGQDQGNDMAMQDQGGYDAPAPPARSQRQSSITAPGLDGVAVDTRRPLASNNPNAGGPIGDDGAQQAYATPEEEYTADYRLITAQRYDQAEAAFRRFIATHPKDRRVADATHWLGESLYQRKQYTDAAEQFLKVTKTYSKSARAPSSMLRLGVTLAAMGEKDAACAALQAVAVKYPKAGPTVISGADREIKKNGCPVG